MFHYKNCMMTLREAWEMSLGENKCREKGLCRFESIRDYPDAVVETCVECGKRLIYNKVGGTIDQQRNRRNHIRDTVQPFGMTGRLFRELYGDNAVDKFRIKEKEARDPKAEAREDLRIMERLSNRGYTDKEILTSR